MRLLLCATVAAGLLAAPTLAADTDRRANCQRMVEMYADLMQSTANQVAQTQQAIYLAASHLEDVSHELAKAMRDIANKQSDHGIYKLIAAWGADREAGTFCGGY